VLLALLAAPVLLFGVDINPRGGEDGRPLYTTSEASDAIKYHIPVIREMAEEWPAVDIVNYRSATSPGYHLAMAGAMKAGASETGLRWINLLAGCAFVGVVGAFAGCIAGWRTAALLGLPLVVSPYVLSSSCWITTDNAALAFVAVAVGCAAFGGGTARASVVGGIGATLAVAVRQLHIWPIAPLALSMKAGSGLLGSIPVVRDVCAGLGLVDEPRTMDWKRFIVGSLAVLAPLALLAFFVWKWQGLMPPMYREKHASGMSWSMPAFSLSLAAIFGGAMLARAWGGVRTLRVRDPFVWGAIVAGLIVALAPATAWNSDAGRMHGWLWEIAKRAPSVADRSLLFVVLAPIGALALLSMWRAASLNGRKRAATILLFAGVCWCAAQMMNAQAWHRYAEPPVLAGIVWLAVLASPAREARASWPKAVGLAAVAGPLALTAWLLIVSAVTIYAKVM
jgi:hypothetical protein